MSPRLVRSSSLRDCFLSEAVSSGETFDEALNGWGEFERGLVEWIEDTNSQETLDA